MAVKKTNSSQIVKNSYIKLKKINSKLKNFNTNLTIKGNSSSFDSVDIITFFSILEKELENHGLKNPNFLNENFFFKYENIKITDVVNIIRKKNEKR
jgi:hypothetical protein